MQKLDALNTRRKTGNEPFHIDGEPLKNSLLEFWQWSSSELVGNALRGMLAEYIVGSALGCVGEVRTQWDAYDLLTPDGIKVEVKSGAYLQSWKQNKLSAIQFGIRPTWTWEARKNRALRERLRQADVYVFCLLKHREKDSIDPLNMSQWDFYVIPTSVLDERLGNQQTVSLSRLLRLEPTATDYLGLSGAVREAS
jgi:hypothetical protein